MFQKRLMFALGLLVAMSMVLSACGGTVTPTQAPTQPAGPTGPTAVPPTTRHGGWLDEIDYSAVNLVGEHQVSEEGALLDRELAGARVVDLRAEHIRRQQVRRELD